MGAVATAYDNAAAESLFATIKRELVHRHRFPTGAAARTAIFEFIEVFYNRRRLHSSIGSRVRKRSRGGCERSSWWLQLPSQSVSTKSGLSQSTTPAEDAWARLPITFGTELGSCAIRLRPR
jgi:transposase InsO family protein